MINNNAAQEIHVRLKFILNNVRNISILTPYQDKQLNRNLIQRFYKHTDSDSISINLSLTDSKN